MLNRPVSIVQVTRDLCGVVTLLIGTFCCTNLCIYTHNCLVSHCNGLYCTCLYLFCVYQHLNFIKSIMNVLEIYNLSSSLCVHCYLMQLWTWYGLRHNWCTVL